MFTDRTAEHFVPKYASHQEHYTKVATFRCNVQPASGDITVLTGGIYGQSLTLFTTYSGLNVGDVVTLSGTATVSGTYLKVKAIQEYFYPPLPHAEATVTLPEA